jgi:hypothetical protein
VGKSTDSFRTVLVYGSDVDAYLLEAVRTPFGRHRGGLCGIRTDDLAALPLAELLRRYPALADPDGSTT